MNSITSGRTIIGKVLAYSTLSNLQVYSNLASYGLTTTKIELLCINKTGELIALAVGKYIIVVNIDTCSINSILEGHRNYIKSLVFGSDGNFTDLLISGGDDSTFLIWNLKTRELIYTSMIYSNPLTAITLNKTSNDFCRLNVGFSNGDLKLFDISFGSRQLSVRCIGSINARDYLHVNKEEEKLPDLVISNKRFVIPDNDLENFNNEINDVSVTVLSVDYVHNSFHDCILLVTPCCLLYINSSSLQVLDIIYTLGHGQGYLGRNKEFEKIGLISHGSSILTNNLDTAIVSCFNPTIYLFRYVNEIYSREVQIITKPDDLPENSVLRNYSFSSTAAVKSTNNKLKDQPVTFQSKIKSSGYGSKPPGIAIKLFSLINLVMTLFNRSKPKVSTKPSKNSEMYLISQIYYLIVSKLYPSDCNILKTMQKQNCVSAIHTAPITRIYYSSDATRLLTSSLDSTILVSKLPFSQGYEPISLVGHIGPVRSCTWNKDSSIVASCGSDRTIKIWKPISYSTSLLSISTIVKNVAPTDGISATNIPFSFELRDVSFFYEDKFIATISADCFYLYRYLIDETRDDIKKSNSKYFKVWDCKFDAQSITSMSCNNSISSSLLYCGLSDKRIIVYDVATQSEVLTLSNCHTRSIDRITQSSASSYQSEPDFNLFATTATDSTARIWDLRSNECVRMFTGHVSRSQPVSAKLSPCNRYLLCGSEDKAAYIYDLRTGGILERLLGITDVVADVDWNPKHPQLATGGYDGKIKFYVE